MIGVAAPPQIDPLVDSIFDVLPEPEGFEFEIHDGRYLWPVFGQDSWRLIIKRGEEKVPVFLPGNYIRFLANAINVVNTEIQKAVPPTP